MNNSTIPTVLSSLLLGMIFFKVYSKDEKKIERFVSFPPSVNSIEYSTEKGGYNATEAANEFYAARRVPEAKMPQIDNIPLPVPDSELGDVPPPDFYNVKRVADVSMQDRQQRHGDLIRGDLDIEAEKICSMFNYVTNRPESLRRGYMNSYLGGSKPEKVENFLKTK